jgi:hypothetical protein
MDETELAYLAGFFDGEGNIDINYKSDGKGRKYYMLRIRVSQLNPAPLKLLKGRFGGNIRIEKLRTTKIVNRPLWTWECSTLSAMLALKSMVPYLLIKREEALIAIAFQERVSLNKNKRLGEEEESFRISSRDTLKQLKTRSWPSGAKAST